MSIYKVNKSDIETFSVITNPFRTYVSSSTQGATGSVHVFARRSSIEKEVMPISSFVESVQNDVDLNATLRTLQQRGRQALNVAGGLTSSFNGMVDDYLDKVNTQQSSVRKQQVLDIDRFTPSFNFTQNTMRKLVIKDVLNTYYRTAFPSAHWAYTNYNSLNFFTSSAVPSGSALLYPNIDGGDLTKHTGYAEGVYALSGAFSFDFYINPRYTADSPDGQYKAGTLFHLSSSYAVSLVSGSAKDANGRACGFRIQLQLSHSAGIVPSKATPGAFPNNLIFLSDDNSLKLNNWHHVIIRWGTNLINDGTGSFNIDDRDRGLFVIPSGTVAPRESDVVDAAKVLAIGNFYEGPNDMASFFANDPATREGLQVLDPEVAVEEPVGYKFRHPLKAEVHDLAIKRYYMSDVDISASASVGPTSMDDNIAFYLPPFFVTETPFRQFIGEAGGILQTPFFEVDGSTNDPFNVALSFGVGGHYINIENFLRDFASNVFPRVHQLSASAIDHTTTARSCNDFLYDDPRVRLRNLLIMPCDDGLFVPSYELLVSESNTNNYVDDLGVDEFSFINIDNMIDTSSLLFGSSFESDVKTSAQANDFVNQSIGFTPEQPGLPPGAAFNNYVATVAAAVASGTFDPGIQTGAPLTIFQRTQDASSNQITMFNISNMFYGQRILPKSFVLTDPSLSGSGGAMSITLKDDGFGGIYRADCLTSQSSWNCVGNIYYDEGLILIKSPHLYFFGKEGYEVSFRGEQGVHVLKIDALAPANQLNSSSNPNFKPVHPTGLPNDTASEFVYITGINFHDENFNVIMKAQLAQPTVKRYGDKISFKVKMDF